MTKWSQINNKYLHIYTHSKQDNEKLARFTVLIIQVGGLFGFGVVFVCVGGKTSGAVFTRIRPYASAPRQAPVPESEATSAAARAAPAKKKETREGGEGRGSGSQEEKLRHRPERRSLPGAAAAAAPRSRNLRGAGGMPGGMMAGWYQDASRMPGVLRPRSRDAPTRSPGAMLTLRLCRPRRSGAGRGHTSPLDVGEGGLVYPKLGGKAAARSGDEGEGLFEAPELCEIWDLHRCALRGEAGNLPRNVTAGCQEGMPGVKWCRGGQACARFFCRETAQLSEPAGPGVGDTSRGAQTRRSCDPLAPGWAPALQRPPTPAHTLGAFSLPPLGTQCRYSDSNTSRWLFPAHHLGGLSATLTTCLQAVIWTLYTLFAVPFPCAHFTVVSNNPECYSVPFF